MVSFWFLAWLCGHPARFLFRSGSGPALGGHLCPHAPTVVADVREDWLQSWSLAVEILNLEMTWVTLCTFHWPEKAMGPC